MVVLPPAVEGEVAGGVSGVVGEGGDEDRLGVWTEGVHRLPVPQERPEAADADGTPCRRACGLP